MKPPKRIVDYHVRRCSCSRATDRRVCLALSCHGTTSTLCLKSHIWSLPLNLAQTTELPEIKQKFNRMIYGFLLIEIFSSSSNLKRSIRRGRMDYPDRRCCSEFRPRYNRRWFCRRRRPIPKLRLSWTKVTNGCSENLNKRILIASTFPLNSSLAEIIPSNFINGVITQMTTITNRS